MKKLQTFMKTVKKMPQRSGMKSAAVVIPSGFSSVEIAQIEKLADELKFKRIKFTSREELEKIITAETASLQTSSQMTKVPLICLLTEKQFAATSLSGVIDLVFKFE